MSEIKYEPFLIEKIRKEYKEQANNYKLFTKHINCRAWFMLAYIFLSIWIILVLSIYNSEWHWAIPSFLMAVLLFMWHKTSKQYFLSTYKVKNSQVLQMTIKKEILEKIYIDHGLFDTPKLLEDLHQGFRNYYDEKTKNVLLIAILGGVMSSLIIEGLRNISVLTKMDRRDWFIVTIALVLIIFFMVLYRNIMKEYYAKDKELAEISQEIYYNSLKS